MNCTFARINGSKCLINFRTNDVHMDMMVQKMNKDLEIIEMKRVEVSDLDGGTLIINGDVCLQTGVEDAAYIYTRFNIIRR